MSRDAAAAPAVVTAPAQNTGGRAAWRPLVLSGGGALLAYALVDITLRLVLTPPELPREVADAVRTYEHSDPDVLVLGSSHVRTFDSVGARVAAATNGDVSLLTVPLEAGKYIGYWWVLKHRLTRLIDETNPQGQRVRPSLRHVIIVTSWWDSCRDPMDTLNIPARAWAFRNFTSDVLGHRVTSYNRAYVTARWAEWLSFSSLVRNRISAWIPGAFREQYFTVEQRAPHEALQTETWQRMVEAGRECMAHPDQMAALDSVYRFFQSRHLPMTLLLYPLKPGTLTAKARGTTLPEFSAMMTERAAQFGIPTIDATTASPLTDDDFDPGYDHLRASGNGHFAQWAVTGPFAFLVELARTSLPKQAAP